MVPFITSPPLITSAFQPLPLPFMGLMFTPTSLLSSIICLLLSSCPLEVPWLIWKVAVYPIQSISLWTISEHLYQVGLKPFEIISPVIGDTSSTIPLIIPGSCIITPAIDLCPPSVVEGFYFVWHGCIIAHMLPTGIGQWDSWTSGTRGVYRGSGFVIIKEGRGEIPFQF